MLAKRFFYVCAGLFLLVLTYHLGARSATAQVGNGPLEALSVGGGRASGVVGRTFYFIDGLGAQGTLAAPVPGAEPVAATSNAEKFNWALLANGDMYESNVNTNYNWVFVGNLVGGGPVGTLRGSLGQLKARFRDAAPAGR